MICIKCKRPITQSYGAKDLMGNYCKACALSLGLTEEQRYNAKMDEAIKAISEFIAKKIFDDIEAIAGHSIGEIRIDNKDFGELRKKYIGEKK